MTKRGGGGSGHDDDVWGWTADIMPETGCLIFAQGATPEQMIAAYGMDPSTARMVPPAEFSEAVPYPVEYGRSEVIRAGRIGDWAFVIDDFLLANTLAIHGHNVTGNLPEGATGAQVLWSSTAEGNISYWTGDGAGGFLDPEQDDPEDFLEQSGADPGLAAGVDFEDFDGPVQVQLLNLLTLVSGIRLPQDVAEGPLLYCQRPPEGAGTRPRPGTRTGLTWLAGQIPDSDKGDQTSGAFCLTFVRGTGDSITENDLLARFDCDPTAAESLPWRRQPDHSDPSSFALLVQTGRAGEWTFAWERGQWHQAVRTETLRRLSAGAEAVVVRFARFDSGGGFSADFAYAADGEEIAAVSTSTPPRWRGSAPGRFQELSRDLALGGPVPPEPVLPGAGPLRTQWANADAARAVLGLAERAFGLSLDEARLRRGTWISAPLLPLLGGLPPSPSPDSPDRGPVPRDQVIALLLARATDAEIRAALGPRIRTLLTGTGMADDQDLADAAEAALNGQPPPVGDSTPAGLALRRLALDSYNTSHSNYSPQTAEERQRRRHRHDTVPVIQSLLVGRYRHALAQAISRSRGPAWREQALEELANVQARISDDELAQAEAAQRRLRPGRAQGM